MELKVPNVLVHIKIMVQGGTNEDKPKENQL